MPAPTPTPPGTVDNTSMYEEVNRLVYEYLQVTGLEKAATAFSAECKAKSIPCPRTGNSANFNQYSGEKLLACFDEGDLDGFLKLWTIFLNNIQLTNDDMKKLEIYLRVHFALWPQAHGEPEPIQLQAMNGLKIFFEEHSHELSSDAGILPLFALPFVVDVQTHPIFRDLFEPTWTQRLKDQLEKTLQKYFELVQENVLSHSKLAGLVMGVTAAGNTTICTSGNDCYHQDRFFQLVTTYRKVRKLLRGTRESYGKLLKVSNELITGLEKTLRGGNISMEPIMEICHGIFPELFTPDILSDGKPDLDHFKKMTSGAIFDSIIDSDVSLFFVGISDMTPESLDYDKIKRVIVGGEAGNRLCVLQALRWLLTKSTAKCRQHTMDSFRTCDILGLNSPDYRDKLFSCMLSATPTYMKECFARFLNAIASMKTGRCYLASTDFTLGLLVKTLHTVKDHNGTFICQMVIATLQKMSLRKQMRLVMIELKVIEWLVVHIKSELARAMADVKTSDPSAVISGYLMEYGWALLMNLCLHEESKGPAAAIAPDILTSVVQMLMAKPSADVAPYVISTLYSLLRNPEIFAMAKRLHLQDTFMTIVSKDTSNLCTHLNQVISLLSVQGYDRVNTSGEVDYDDDDCNDPDEFEPEIEVQETWVGSLDEGALTGDDLLVRAYMRVGLGDAVVVPSQPKPIPEKTECELFLRPTTPSKAPVPKAKKIVRRKESAANATSTTAGLTTTTTTSVPLPPAVGSLSTLGNKSFLLKNNTTKKTGKTVGLKKRSKSRASDTPSPNLEVKETVKISLGGQAPGKTVIAYYDDVFNTVAGRQKSTGTGGAGEDTVVNGINKF